MPFKSGFRLVKKYCLWCGGELILNNNRDLKRKKYCSHGHRQLWRYAHGEWDMKYVSQYSNTPQVNKKKSRPKELNGRWLGDRRKLKRPMTSYEGNIWRKTIYERDNYTCQICGKRGNKLNADHIKPFSLYPEMKWNLNNGRTLCIDCHKQTETYGWKMVNIMKEGEFYSISQ